MNAIHLFGTWLLVIATTVSGAGLPAPLGFELGTTTVDALKTTVGRTAAPVERGLSAYSGGKIIEVPPGAFDVEGLKAATFIFDVKEHLAAVELRFGKGFGNANTTKLADTLGLKYRQVERSIPRAGNASARYVGGDAVVVLDAPHLMFDCTVTYMTTAFEKAYQQAESKARRDKERATRETL